MKALTTQEITQACNGKTTGDAVVTSVCIDSRKVKEGCLFIAIKGDNFDGHDFISKAVEDGACAVMCSREIDCDVPLILVDDTRKALLDLARYYRCSFDGLNVVGITGSVGKTTTKEMTYAVLSQKYKTLRNEGNLNNDIGLPLTLFGLDDSYEALVSEMGMSNFGEIETLTKTAKPDVALITNIGVSHMENLGSRENILKAKLEILKGLPDNGKVILNADNDLLSEAEIPQNFKKMYYGIENAKCDIIAKDIESSENQTQFTILYDGGKEIKAVIPTIGIHNVYDALAAFACGICLGVTAEESIKGLLNYVPAGLRQKVTEHDGMVFIEDCYNASPDSMKAALNTLSEIKVKRRIAVLGDMLELGKISEQAHYDVGVYAAEKKTDMLFSYGPHSEIMIKGASDNGMKEVYAFKDKEALNEKLKNILQPEDGVLFKASRGMKLEEVIDNLYGVKK